MVFQSNNDSSPEVSYQNKSPSGGSPQLVSERDNIIHNKHIIDSESRNVEPMEEGKGELEGLDLSLNVRRDSMTDSESGDSGIQSNSSPDIYATMLHTPSLAPMTPFPCAAENSGTGSPANQMTESVETASKSSTGSDITEHPLNLSPTDLSEDSGPPKLSPASPLDKPKLQAGNGILERSPSDTMLAGALLKLYNSPGLPTHHELPEGKPGPLGHNIHGTYPMNMARAVKDEPQVKVEYQNSPSGYGRHLSNQMSSESRSSDDSPPVLQAVSSPTFMRSPTTLDSPPALVAAAPRPGHLQRELDAATIRRYKYEPILPPCQVCGDQASGYHYGANTCEACKVISEIKHIN